MSWCWQKKKNGNACLSSYVKGYELLRLHYFKKLKHKILRRMTSLALSTKENKGNKNDHTLVQHSTNSRTSREE